MKAQVILTLFISICLVSCKNNTESNKYQLQEIKSISLKNTDSLSTSGNIFDICQDEKGNYFLADFTNHSVLVVDTSGKLLKQIGKQGAGPGELQEPVSIAAHNDSLFVLEAGNKRISIFRTDGKFLYSFPVSSPLPSSLLVHPNLSRLVAIDAFGFSPLCFYELNGKLVHEKISEKRANITVPLKIAGGQISSKDNHHFLYTSFLEPEIIEYNWKGDTIATIQMNNVPEYSKPALNSREAYMEQDYISIVCVPFFCDSLYLIQRINNPLNNREVEKKRYIDFYSANKNYINTIMPHSQIIEKNKSGLLISFENDSKGSDFKSSLVFYSIVCQ